MYKYLNFLIILLPLGFTGCLSNHRNPPNLTSQEKYVAQSNNTFGFRIFQELVKEEPRDSNVVISPLSISMALGMTYNGAAGETKTAMEKTLGFSGLSTREINQAYKGLMDMQSNLDSKIIFNIANSIWYKQEFPVKQGFIDTCKEYFDAEVSSLNFSSSDAINTINNWVDEHTNGKIKKIIDYISPLDVMFLINAIYFKGIWEYTFPESLTKDDTFRLADGSKIPCKMMSQKAKYNYFESPDFQSIELKYGDGWFSMIIFLPKDDEDIDSIIGNFTEENWDNWINSFKEETINLFLPKFEIKYGKKLNNVLKQMGMGIAFDGCRADFSNISDTLIFISRVKHKIYIKVDEQGTEAAAATSVALSYGAGTKTMYIDHPFIFIIKENHSNTILFIGRVMKPA